MLALLSSAVLFAVTSRLAGLLRKARSLLVWVETVSETKHAGLRLLICAALHSCGKGAYGLPKLKPKHNSMYAVLQAYGAIEMRPSCLLSCTMITSSLSG